MKKRNIEEVSEFVPSKKITQFLGYTQKLNHCFFETCSKWEVEKDQSQALKDYIDYAEQLQDMFTKSSGEVLTFGSGDCGQLGHGIDNDEDLTVKYPRIVHSLKSKHVISISCGGLHNAICTLSGEVFSWGCSDDGSLGRTGDENKPCLVKDLMHEKVISVSCGDGQTIALTEEGKVYGWGCFKDKEGKKWFNYSQDSKNPKKEMKDQRNSPILIHGLNKILKIACGAAHCLALNSENKVYSWGISECGEMGRELPPLKKEITDANGEKDMVYDLDSIQNVFLNPNFMQLRKENKNIVVDFAKSISCGSFHSFVIGLNNVVLSCGLNNYGQLGFDDLKSRDYLTEVSSLKNKDIVDIKGGIHHSVVSTRDNKIFSFGRGDSGQLGSKQMENKSPGAFSTEPLEVHLNKINETNDNEEIKMIACGGNHNLLLTKVGNVYSWGYGDMSALGHGKDVDEMVPRKLNLAKADIKLTKVSFVAGGGQHSALIGTN